MFDTNAEELIGAAILVVVGMAVVFVGLSILMVASMITIKIFRPKEENGVNQNTAPEVALSDGPGAASKGTIHAMAWGLALSMEKGDVISVGEPRGATSVMAAGTAGTWAVAGREQQMRSRGKAGHQWGKRSG